MFKNQEILNSYNFARQSDIVFSEIVTKKQFEMLNLKNVEIIDENERLIFYKLTKLTLKENDLIFCNTDVVKNLPVDISDHAMPKDFSSAAIATR